MLRHLWKRRCCLERRRENVESQLRRVLGGVGLDIHGGPWPPSRQSGIRMFFVPNLRCTEKKICSACPGPLASGSPTPCRALLSTDQVAAISGCCELLATWKNIGIR